MRNPRIQNNQPSRQTIGLPSGLPSELIPIGREVLRIHESAELSSQSQFEQGKIWRALNLWLGVPSAVSAALAGSAILSSGEAREFAGVSLTVIGGALALLAAALSATLTTVNAARRGNQALASGNAFLQLQTEARQVATIDLATFDYEAARQALESITTSRNELNKTADAPGRLAYRRANKRVHVERGQDYAVDREQGQG